MSKDVPSIVRANEREQKSFFQIFHLDNIEASTQQMTATTMKNGNTRMNFLSALVSCHLSIVLKLFSATIDQFKYVECCDDMLQLFMFLFLASLLLSLLIYLCVRILHS